MAYYVNLYLANRAYGGPEEGGWWYDTGEAIRTIPCHTRRKAERALKWVECIAHHRNVRDGRREPSSVLCNGYYQVFIENFPARDFPDARPHYE